MDNDDQDQDEEFGDLEASGGLTSDIVQNVGDYEIEKDVRNYFEANDLKKLKEVSNLYYCAKCMKRKPLRGWHCKETNKCVANFHLYSTFFQRPITKKNHAQYYIFITLQTLTFYLFIACYWEADYSRTYLIMLIYLLYTFGYWAVLTYGILANLTWNEIWNSY